MTTIAWDGQTLAGDCQMEDDNGVLQSTTKVFKYGGHLYGLCGVLAHAKTLLDWIMEGEGKPFPAPELVDGGSVIHISREGRVMKYEGSPVGFEVTSVPCAFGSGAVAALVAMRELGLRAPAAVAVAANYDRNTGRGVEALNLT